MATLRAIQRAISSVSEGDPQSEKPIAQPKEIKAAPENKDEIQQPIKQSILEQLAKYEAMAEKENTKRPEANREKTKRHEMDR